MRFWKMNGTGNDFLLLRDRSLTLSPEELSSLAVLLCDRRRALGGDGLMVVRPPTAGGDFSMVFYNRDGSPGEMCGNGARCLCRWGYETGLCGPVQRVETPSGLVVGQRLDARRYRVSLPPVTAMEGELSLSAAGTVLPCAYIELGSPPLPHALLPWKAWGEEGKLRAVAEGMRFHPRFPKGANVTFYQVLTPHRVMACTYERGVEDFTLSCGTGAGSLGAYLTATGQGKSPLTVVMPGGELTVEAEGRALSLSGLTTLAAEGEWTGEGELPPSQGWDGLFERPQSGQG